MVATWKHPKFGRFEHNDLWWERWISESGEDDPGTGVRFAIVTSSKRKNPSKAAVELSIRFIKNQEKLLDRAVYALWDDLSGNGPQSGMWWHGCLDQIRQESTDRGYPPLNGPEDLYQMLHLDAYFVRERVARRPQPVVEIGMSVHFARGRGIGVLTDGSSILGIGFAHDAMLFGDNAKKRKQREEARQPTWIHPKLGRFEHNGLWWEKTVWAPAFQNFGDNETGDPTGSYTLAFETSGPETFPSPAAVSFARRVLANSDALAPKVLKAFWNDVTGDGPDSGMWWHGNLDELNAVLEANNYDPVTSPEDLCPLLGLAGFHILPRNWGYNRPVMSIAIEPPFEQEHGVGILTDGRSVLGIGYSDSVSLFKPKKKRPAKRRSKL